MVKCDSVPGLPDKEMAAMELGLAHSLSRYKLKFSPDKIDTMIVQVNARMQPSFNQHHDCFPGCFPPG